ncbi:MAG: hypothetical protein U5K69_19910 [Balneolaceae bacterium]|nr:hypothetical protein [Balneolaceae bacterium]
MDETDKLFVKYLAGELPPDEEQQALHKIADNQQLRSLLRFELKLKQAFQDKPDLSTFEVPEGFSNKVMADIQTVEISVTNDQEEASTLLDWLGWLWQPQQVEWKPAYAVVLVLLTTVVLALPLYNGGELVVTPQQSSMEQSVQTVSETPAEVWLRFVYIDENAKSVAVAGDFSNWEPVSLTRQEFNGQQIWTGLVSMPRGEHRYMFVKNGDQWVTDPLAPMYREDGFGNKNAVIYL